MSIHSRSPRYFSLLCASALLCACSEEEHESWASDEPIAERNLGQCTTVPAHETVTLGASGTYSEDAPSILMSQTGCDHRFVVDFVNPSLDPVYLSKDLIKVAAPGSWSFDNQYDCERAYAAMEVYKRPTLGVFTTVGAWQYVGEWDGDSCAPTEINDNDRLPVVLSGSATIRVAAYAEMENMLCLGGGSPPYCIGAAQTYPVPTWARATVVVP